MKSRYLLNRSSHLIAFFILLPLISSCATTRVISETPLEDSIQYGVASWYGEDFHGKPTASGVIYDMYGLSAAHRTLPLGTIARVKNLKNNREVEVVINDRGPFIDGRILDLSFGAARELDMVEDGLADIRLEVIGRDPSYIRTVKVTDSGTGAFVIQVGSFLDLSNARRLKTALGWKNSNVYIEEVFLRGSTYYRVRVGRYAERASALIDAERLAEEGYPVWVTRTGKD